MSRFDDQYDRWEADLRQNGYRGEFRYRRQLDPDEIALIVLCTLLAAFIVSLLLVAMMSL